jgi:hypothetical protein
MLDLEFGLVEHGARDFEAVLALRQQAYGRELAGRRDAIDEYSHHFVARLHHQIVAALRVTCVKDGPLMSMEHYPSWLLHAFGDTLLATSRLCVSPSLPANPRVPQQLLRCGWEEMLPRGMRVNVAVARQETAPYYFRQGCVFVRNCTFRYDQWPVDCGLIAFTADPIRTTPYRDLFQGLELPESFPCLNDSHLFITSMKELRGSNAAAA